MNNSLDTIEGIAVIGMAGRFPGAQNIDQFWQNLCEGVESISKFSDEDLEAQDVPFSVYSDPNYVKAGTILEDIDMFDAEFFGFSPREAEITDPQHRIFLEVVWDAFEMAGYAPDAYPGPIGVYAGASMNDYAFKFLSRQETITSTEGYQNMLGNEKDYLTSRVSYKLNLRGPSFTVQTACSTSLVAVHLACQDLLNYQSDMAVAGGVCINLPQKQGYLYHEGLIFSPDGHCRAFDAKARGTVAGQGVAAIILKRLSDAITDGDTIYAVIRGSAINNDGALKIGPTAPSIDGQAEVIAAALALEQIDPETITYIEAHGTGTPLGDPIEIAALTQVFGASTQKKGFCAIGSVKTNMGHLDVAAGVTGLIKTVLALKHKQIPPSLHFEEPNPEIDFKNSPFFVNTELKEWRVEEFPRRAGVSSFGIGGTNAHVVLEEAPAAQPSGPSRPQQLLLLSAKTDTALDAMTQNLAEHLKQHPNVNLADVAFTLQVGRKVLPHRRMLICQDRADALAALDLPDPNRVVTAFQEPVSRGVAFMFSGQGSQYVNMGLELYQTESVFREQIDNCAEILKPQLELDLRKILYPDEKKAPEASKMLSQTAITQPALFALEYALAKLWMAWGLKPAGMVGHSIGEYVAACLAGVFSLEDALSLVATRGRLMQALPKGSMLAVSLSEKEIQPLLGKQLSLAVISSPSLCVISGEKEAVDDAENRFSKKDVACRQLHTSHAFHSPMMDPILAEFTEQVKQVPRNLPQIPFVSNLTGTWIRADEATDPAYWSQHLRQTVRLADCLNELLNEPNRVLLEVGPGNTLSTLAKQCAGKAQDHPVFSSMRHPKDQTSDAAFILTALGRLWLSGIQPDWAGFYADEKRRRLPLPTYPFERQRFWITHSNQIKTGRPGLEAERTSKKSLSQQKNNLSDWFYIPSWKHSPTPHLSSGEIPTRSCWLIFLDKVGFGAQLAKRLEQNDQDVFKVRLGKKFSRRKDRVYTINPQHSHNYEALFNDLRNRNKIPKTIIHLWNVSNNDSKKTGLRYIDETQDLGIYSLLNIVQALGKSGINNKSRIEVVSSNIHEVTGNEMLSPEKATLLGACNVIPLEYSNISCRSVDIDFPQKSSQNQNVLIDQLLAEFNSDSADAMVAYRGNYRWVQSFEPVQMDENMESQTRLREGGVYLIAGGLGGIGLALAEDIAKTVRAKLILTGRSEFPSRNDWEQRLDTHNDEDQTSHKIKKLQAIEQMGSEVFVASADIANLEQMQKVIVRATERFGRLNGVIHAAGVIDDVGTIQRRSREMTERGLASKVKGTLVINEVLKTDALDFVLLCSSIASVLYHNRLAQVSYVAANSFLDAYSTYKNRKDGTVTITINWDDWQDVGMSAKANEQFLKTFGSTGHLVDPLDQFTPSEGAIIFRRILNSGLSRVIVSTRDLIKRVEQDIFISSPFLEAATKKELFISAHPRPNIANPYIPPESHTEQKMAHIWQELLGVNKVGVQDDFFALGGDSLIAVRLFARIEKVFGKNLPLATLYEASTIAKLVNLIHGEESKPNWSSLVQIQLGNSKPPIFCIHGAGGNILIYRDLARYLGPDQTVYGLQSQGLDGKKPFLTRIEDMASHYLEEIQAVQPEGPYILGGYCLGGTVAFEMAQRLCAQGQKVALLFLLETYNWKYISYESLLDKSYFQLQKVWFHWRNFSLLKSNEKLTFIQEKFKVAKNRRFVWYGMLAAKMRHTFRLGQEHNSSLFSLWENNDNAALAYEPKVYPGRITQFRPIRDYTRYDNPNFGWEKLTTEGVEIHKLPIFPAGMLIKPLVPLLAEKLKLCIQKALESRADK